MDGRKVKYVEAHVANGGQPVNDIPERSVPRWIAALTARKKFVPGGEFRRAPVRDDRHFPTDVPSWPGVGARDADGSGFTGQ